MGKDERSKTEERKKIDMAKLHMGQKWYKVHSKN